MKAKQINLGVVGAGNMGLGFALRCTKLDTAKVIAIADVPEVCSAYRALAKGKIEEFLKEFSKHKPGMVSRARSDPEVSIALKILAKELDPEKIYSDYHDLAEDSDIEGVYVATPNVYHAPVSITMLENNKHVLCEKPMATRVDEAEEMIKASKKSGKILQIGFHHRFDPDAQYVRSLVKAGVLGPIYKTKSYAIHVNRGPGGWFVQKELAGGGALIDMGVHAIDMTRFLLGDPKAKKVYAKIETRFGDYDVDDVDILVIEFDNGCTSIVESGWWNTYSDGSEAATQVFGEKGYARIYPTEVHTKIGDTWGVFKPSFKRRGSAHFLIIEHFVDCILTGKPTISPGEAGLEAQKIIEAAYKSSELGKAIFI